MNEQQLSNQRTSFRIQLNEGREGGSLVLGDREVPVQVVDESAGGFAVTVSCDLAIEKDQTCLLKTSAGCCEVRIARKEIYPDGLLLGLMRLRDLQETVEDDPKAATIWKSLLLSPHLSAIRAGTTVVGGILVMCAAVVLMQHQTRSSSVNTTPEAQLTTAVADLAGAMTERTRNVGGVAAEPIIEAVQTRESNSHAGTPSDSQPLENAGQKAVQTIPSLDISRLLARQKRLVTPQVSSRLRLSPDQNRRLEHIIKKSESKVLGSGDEAAPSNSADAWETIRIAESQILQILTPQQAEKWRQIREP